MRGFIQIALAGLLSLGAVGWAATSPVAPATTAPPASVECRDLKDLDRPLTPEQLQAAQVCQEVAKLKEEVAAIRAANRVSTQGLGPLIPWTGVITGLISGFIALIVGVLGFTLRGSYERSQRDKLHQERLLQREEHNLRLMEGLGSPNRAVQLASVSSLLRRIEEIRTHGDRNARGAFEFKTLSDVVVSVLRDPAIEESVSKYLADEMISVFDLRGAPQSDSEPSPRGASAAGAKALRLRDFNLQRTRLRNVYWADVSATEVDFFKADFTGASLRRANLQGAILYEADLREAVLAEANLTGANLQGADLRGARLAGANFTGANLSDARFDHTTRWDDHTIWPDGFRPQIDVSTA